MIVKKRDFPLQMLKLEALSRRLSQTHPLKKHIEKLAKNALIGFKGEQLIDFNLSLLTKSDFRIFHNLQLTDQQGNFQIDTLLLSQEFAVIIEVKNIYGLITFDDLGQSLRTGDNNVVEPFPNPIEQVELQRFRLERLLDNYKIPKISINTLVVYSDNRTILKNTSNNKLVKEKVIHRYNINSKINELSKRFSVKVLSERDIKRIELILTTNHKTFNVDLFQKFDLNKADLVKGVFCPKCQTSVMARIHGSWLCSSCGERFPDAHITALQDYYMLVDKKINNREARKFLMIESTHVTKRLLQKAGVESSGNTWSKLYYLDKIIEPLISKYN